MNNILNYLLIAVFIVLSAFFSASEIAFAGANKLRLKNNVEQRGGLRDKLALKVSEDYDDILASILIGNNLVNIAASSVATVIVLSLLGENFAFVATVVMTLLILIFGEILPKVIAKQRWESFTRFFAIPVYVLSKLLTPVVFAVMLIVDLVSKLWKNRVSDVDAVSAEDLENIIDIVEDEGVLDEEDCDLLQNALEFDDVSAYEIVTPRVDMTAIDIHDAYEKNIKILLDSPFSRVPVYEDTPDNIIGILLINHVLKDLVDENRVSFRKLLVPPVFVHKTMPLPDVLEKMKENKSHMVIVLDEYGGTLGLLTMEDILEQLVGEIWDESDDVKEEFICIDDNHFEALGDMRIYDFFDEFDIDVDETDFEDDNVTVGGWVTDMLDGEVEEGNTFDFEFLRISVIETDGMRVEKILAEIFKDEEKPEETAQDLL